MTENASPDSRAAGRRLLLAALAVVALALVVAVAFALWPDEEGVATVTDENFRGIELGMTRPSVEEILGRPPEDASRAYRLIYCGGNWNYRGAGGIYPSLSNQDLADLRPVSPGGSIAVWPGQGPEAMVVEFDAGGKVYGVAHLDHGVPKPSRWERFLKMWFGL